MQRILASKFFLSMRRGTMNGFALYLQAKVGLKYDCGVLPKNWENPTTEMA
jgi:hypothetical protein